MLMLGPFGFDDDNKNGEQIAFVDLHLSHLLQTKYKRKKNKNKICK